MKEYLKKLEHLRLKIIFLYLSIIVFFSLILVISNKKDYLLETVVDFVGVLIFIVAVYIVEVTDVKKLKENFYQQILSPVLIEKGIVFKEYPSDVPQLLTRIFPFDGHFLIFKTMEFSTINDKYQILDMLVSVPLLGYRKLASRKYFGIIYSDTFVEGKKVLVIDKCRRRETKIFEYNCKVSQCMYSKCENKVNRKLLIEFINELKRLYKVPLICPIDEDYINFLLQTIESLALKLQKMTIYFEK